MTSAGVAAASAAGVVQRAIPSRQTGSTRATGVCWSITSDTSTAHASTSGRRQGRSRAADAYQSTIRSPVSSGGASAVTLRMPPVSLGTVLTSAQSAVPWPRRAGAVAGRVRASVPPVLHPVGPLPAAVYWRRRALVLTLLLSVLGGGGWGGWAVATGRSAEGTTTASATGSAGSTSPPALERVVPALASVQLPTAPATPVVATTPAAPLPAPGSPCTDDMLSLEARAP